MNAQENGKKEVLFVGKPNHYTEGLDNAMQGRNFNLTYVSGVGEAFRSYRKQHSDVIVIPGVMTGCAPETFIGYIRRKEALQKAEKTAHIVVLDKKEISGNTEDVRLVPNRFNYDSVVSAIGE